MQETASPAMNLHESFTYQNAIPTTEIRIQFALLPDAADALHPWRSMVLTRIEFRSLAFDRAVGTGLG